MANCNDVAGDMLSKLQDGMGGMGDPSRFAMPEHDINAMECDDWAYEHAMEEEQHRQAQYHAMLQQQEAEAARVAAEQQQLQEAESDWHNEYTEQDHSVAAMAPDSMPAEAWAEQFQVDQPQEQTWVNEYQQEAQAHEAIEGVEQNDMISEFLQQREAEGGHCADVNDEFTREFLRNRAQAEDDDEFAEVDGEDWIREYNEMTRNYDEMAHSTDYPFEPNNAFIFHDNPLQEGLELLEAGSLSDAALAFEAACQKQPADAQTPDVWRLLGTTQQENEKDRLAILALNKARQLAPKDRVVLQALAISHTNESNILHAANALKDWVLAHEEYAPLESIIKSDGAPTQLPEEETFDNEFLREFQMASNSQLGEIETLLLAASELNPADAEVHINLGVIHNLMNDYDEAALNFEAAVKLRPNDEKAWNKLGATLANGRRSDEAIAAYDRALDINPGFVRAHYNLGVALSNMGKHEQAAKQFIRTIIMQQGGPDNVPNDPSDIAPANRPIWDVLRMTFNLMGRADLVSKAWQHNIKVFQDEFPLSEFSY